MKRIVIFASGSGTNTENLIAFFDKKMDVSVVQVLTNNPKAKVLERCKKWKINSFVFNKDSFSNSKHVLNFLQKLKPDLIVLAGFLWKIPKNMISAFPNKIINIHPALLPNYGGKGMYGMHVHQAVVANGDNQTGITIHYVNEHYDDGAIIFQTACDISPSETAQDIAVKIHALEMEYFPKIVNSLLNE